MKLTGQVAFDSYGPRQGGDWILFNIYEKDGEKLPYTTTCQLFIDNLQLRARMERQGNAVIEVTAEYRGEVTVSLYREGTHEAWVDSTEVTLEEYVVKDIHDEGAAQAIEMRGKVVGVLGDFPILSENGVIYFQPEPGSPESSDEPISISVRDEALIRKIERKLNRAVTITVAKLGSRAADVPDYLLLDLLDPLDINDEKIEITPPGYTESKAETKTEQQDPVAERLLARSPDTGDWWIPYEVIQAASEKAGFVCNAMDGDEVACLNYNHLTDGMTRIKNGNQFWVQYAVRVRGGENAIANNTPHHEFTIVRLSCRHTYHSACFQHLIDDLQFDQRQSTYHTCPLCFIQTMLTATPEPADEKEITDITGETEEAFNTWVLRYQ